jgi:hypothetical protein
MASGARHGRYVRTRPGRAPCGRQERAQDIRVPRCCPPARLPVSHDDRPEPQKDA